ncbi:helix-turn-helix transcriptional regulator [Parenemella sanctibonifatiensis]|uniref:DNA-binding transcriptional regulator n=1 Tax=Parenemella sanctibonifatiensis TaxID=2016505 RepID=A0A255EBK9_9ACTN|nr:WYL domain-containing protein [Parenemella sanctibonifatiensis]OYN88311.1 DNA-binding transcriptional regulator [Parenemella sanctibonifatiensis]
MRADRLVSLVLLLRQRGQLTADQLATELEVSPRTVLRDIEALSTAGIPVYANRGRHGGFALLPGLRSELTGLNHDEALALASAGAAPGARQLGLDAALASALRKIVDALPTAHQERLQLASGRILVEPATDLLSRPTTTDEIDPDVTAETRRAVVDARKLRFAYAAPGQPPRWHTVDPLGLVTVRNRTYLLATKAGEDRTYRLSRMARASVQLEAADRPAEVDLEQLWAERRDRFLSEDHLTVAVRVASVRREELLTSARAVLTSEPDRDGWERLEVTFEDLRHAIWALWQLGTDVEALHPTTLRDALRERAELVAARHSGN